jgi:hypothetical protein
MIFSGTKVKPFKLHIISTIMAGIINEDLLFASRKQLVHPAFRTEAYAQRPLLIQHLISHFQDSYVLNAKQERPELGIPTYDLELAAARQLDVSDVGHFATALAIGMNNASLQYWQSRMPASWADKVALMAKFSNAGGEKGKQYRHTAGATLRFMEALGLAKPEWEVLDDCIKRISTRPITIQQRRNESFFARTGNEEAYAALHLGPLPAGKRR